MPDPIVFVTLGVCVLALFVGYFGMALLCQRTDRLHETQRATCDPDCRSIARTRSPSRDRRR